MSRRRETKIFAVIALVLSIVGISFGLTTYIKNTSINADNNDNIQFRELNKKEVVFSGNDNIKDNKTSNLGISLNKDNNVVTKKLKVTNYSNNNKYLDSIKIDNGFKCNVLSSTDKVYIDALCNMVNISISIDSASAVFTNNKGINYQSLDKSTYGMIKPNESKDIVIAVSIDNINVMPAGDVDIEIPTVTFNYK